MRVRISGDAARVLRGIRPKTLLHGIAQIMRKPGHESFPLEVPSVETVIPEEEEDVEEPKVTITATDGFVGLSAASATTDNAPTIDACVSFGGLKLFYNAVSNVGLVRARNEDSCGLFIPPNAEVLKLMGVLAVLADGMGGHECGDRASSLVMESVGKSYYESRQKDPGEALVSAVESAHQAILADSSITGRDMGSTCSVLLFRGNTAYAAHVGDSRIYRWRDGLLEQFTADDSLVAEMVRRGMLTPAQAHRHPDRSVLLNALGQTEVLTVSRASTPCELQDGDEFLICSDGLHGLVTDAEIAGLLGVASSLAVANEDLLELALERGGGDNVSMVLIRVRCGGNPESVSG